MALEQAHPNIAAGDHKGYMEYALKQARLSPPAPTKFCVRAVMVDADRNEVLSTGYSMELPGDRLGDPENTHAEQCCFIKIAGMHGIPVGRIGEVLPQHTVLYRTMEPCNQRLSGNRTCVDRILGLKSAIKGMFVGITEPGRLEDAGISVVVMDDMRDRILKVSLAGHDTRTNQ